MKSTAKKKQDAERNQSASLPAISTYGRWHLDQAHVEFIRLMAARGFGPLETCRRLSNTDFGAEFNFIPRKVNRTSVWTVVKQMTQAEKIALRLAYYANCTKHPLMESHERVIELAKIALNPRTEDKTRVMALRAIREETGADAKLLADAIRDNGNALADVLRSAVNARIANATDTDREHMRRNVLVALNQRSASGQFSAN